jgi:3D (Asp-Asp-Asp) domain-containing protein
MLQFFIQTKFYFSAFVIIAAFQSCDNFKKKKELEVTATAFNSLHWQTDVESPSLAAWGDTLKPGMKAIAVSRDLIDSGLTHNTEVFIEELDQTFLVKDKMNRRWTKKIDIYMGIDVKEARKFGKQKVNINWPE